jgi:hypothetical protein
MSTRATITFKSGDEPATLYQYGDGYPSFVAKALRLAATMHVGHIHPHTPEWLVPAYSWAAIETMRAGWDVEVSAFNPQFCGILRLAQNTEQGNRPDWRYTVEREPGGELIVTASRGLDPDRAEYRGTLADFPAWAEANPS